MHEPNTFCIYRWDWETEEEIKKQYTDDWNIGCYLPWSKRHVQCGHCGSDVDIKQSYPSMELRTVAGYCIAVCQSCFLDEMTRREASWDESQPFT